MCRDIEMNHATIGIGSRQRDRKLIVLESQGSIFDGDGLVTAQQESDESKDRQEKGWHVLRLFVPKSFEVNLLRADAIMVNDTLGL
jgi:hypothetical protein